MNSILEKKNQLLHLSHSTCMSPAHRKQQPVWSNPIVRLALVGWLLACGVIPARSAEWFVSPQGNDQNSGTAAKPFATPTRALGAFREYKKERDLREPSTIYLGQGTYRLTKPLELTTRENGQANAPLIIRPWQKEIVILSGAREIGGFVSVSDPDILKRLPPKAHAHVRQASLEDMPDLGQAVSSGNRLELFFNKEAMRLARWPNKGFVKIQELKGGQPLVVHGLLGDKAGRFTYEGSRPERWLAEPEIWLHGYWFWDWSDAWQRVQRIDPREHLMELTPPHHHYGYRQGQRYYAANLLSELDEPGEWYVDRNKKRLYFWPPQTLEKGAVEISLGKTLINFRDAQWIELQGLILESTRDTAVSIQGGEHVLLKGCVIRNTGGWGVRIAGGNSHGVEGCDIYQTGEGGVSLSGGNRKSLMPARHFAVNNHIHHFGRLQRTYRPAVGIGGVGQRVAHNLIHDGPHNAIQLSGNDHLIEFNEIHHVCFETGDVGAFYTGRDWTARGTIIRHNYFHDIQGPGLHGAMAVYLDDSASGFTIHGNLFVRAGRAAFIGGGRDNKVENNIFVDCKPAVHVDARGLGWMKYHVDPGGTLPKRLEVMPYRQSPWKERYPELLTLLDEDPGAPRGNVIRRNISEGGKWSNIEAKALPLVRMEDNMVDSDPGFIDPSKGNYSLRKNSPAWEQGFQPIPLEQIGLKDDDPRMLRPNLNH